MRGLHGPKELEEAIKQSEESALAIIKGGSLIYDDYGHCLNLTVEHGMLDVQRELCNLGSKIRFGGFPGDRAINYAIGLENSELVLMLVKNGCNIWNGDENGNTVLHLVCLRKNPKICKILLDGGADLKTKNKDNENAARFAIKMGAVRCLELMLAKGAFVRYGDS